VGLLLLTHTETTLSVDTAMIKFLDDSGSIDHCLCAALVSCAEILLGKKIRICVFGKKDMQPIMSTSCYLGPVFSYLRNSICLNGSHMDARKICDLTVVHLFMCMFNLGHRTVNLQQAPRYLNPALEVVRVSLMTR